MFGLLEGMSGEEDAMSAGREGTDDHVRISAERVIARLPDLFSVSPLGCGAPAAVNLGLYPIRGFNPLDYFRYKNYLRMVSDSELPTTPSEVVDGFPIVNRRLLDLLGVRYLLAPSDDVPPEADWHVAFDDPRPFVTYNYNYPHHGMEILSPYTVYENDAVMPRAFVVPTALPMPAGREKEAMLSTDFRKTVLVEGCDPADCAAGSEGSFRAARIVEYQPNCVKIEVEGDSPGWLMLTDMWFPGWTCTIDGEALPNYSGNYLFRTIPVPAGRHEIVFRFLPKSYVLGSRITVTALGGPMGLGSVSILRHARLRKTKHRPVCEREAVGIAA
jgi:hypothetical protein